MSAIGKSVRLFLMTPLLRFRIRLRLLRSSKSPPGGLTRLGNKSMASLLSERDLAATTLGTAGWEPATNVYGSNSLQRAH